MKNYSGVAFWWCMVVVLWLVGLGQIPETEAAICNPAELSPCLPSIISGSPPTQECCTKAGQQVPCFCKYMKDPAYGNIVKNPNTRKAVEACGLKWPTCPA